MNWRGLTIGGCRQALAAQELRYEEALTRQAATIAGLEEALSHAHLKVGELQIKLAAYEDKQK